MAETGLTEKIYTDDASLLDGFIYRDEEALAEAERKYGKRMLAVAKQITGSDADAEECVSDALYRAWCAIPPAKPCSLRYYLIRAVRNSAVNLCKSRTTAKRGGETIPLQELEELLPGDGDPAARLEQKELTAALNEFLAGLPREKQAIFLRRYFYLQSTAEIAKSCGISESKVRTTLTRLRKALKNELRQKQLLP